MAATCSTCRAELPSEARFCPSCGSPIEAAPTVQERRLVTVLFADVMGSTGLAELMDAERLQEVMSTFFEAMREEIEAEGGSVEKFIGDAVMAVFGLPAAHEDDPARAMRAALRMRERLPALNESLMHRHGVTLEMRMGVNTGGVLATTGPQLDVGTLAGDAINVAARLEQAAQPGQVLVSERTLRGGRGFRVREVDLLHLRGREEPVRAFELQASELALERGLPGLRAPMVGRAQEMELLSSVYERVASERRPHLATIYGVAGVGKSRLIAEFTEWIQGRPDSPTLVRGRCLPYGQEVTYWPLAEILKGEAGVLNTDPPDVALEKIRKSGRELLTPGLADDPQRATAALAYTIGLDDPEANLSQLPPRQVRLEIRLAWRSFFSALALERPVVAVVEDIHWADPALLELLEELAERVEGSVFFLCPARPELTERRPDWGGGRRNYSSVFLEPLSSDESEQLLGFLLEIEDLPSQVRQQVLERAEGNPFFLEEVLRQLIDEGRIVREGDRWHAAARIDEVHVPDTIQAVLGARMDLLDTFEKRVLQCAAVIGRVFWTGPLAELLEESEERLDRTLDRLEDRQLVMSRLTSSMAGQREYAFNHILTQQVAYETLPRRDRTGLHALAAGWIEETAGQRRREVMEVLAQHYAEAYGGALEDARWEGEREDLRLKAFEYLLEASEDARSKLALDRAVQLAERALSAAAGPLERSRALEAIGLAHTLGYDGDLAWRNLREAVEERLAADVEEPLAIARLCAMAVDVPIRWPGSMRASAPEPEVAHYLELGLGKVPPGDSEEMTRLLMAKAGWPWGFGSAGPEFLEEARVAGEEAVAMARRLGRPDLESAALDNACSAYGAEGLHTVGMQLAHQRLALVEAEVLRDPWEVGDAFAMAALFSYHLGRYPDSHRYGDRGFRRTIGDVPGVALHCLAWRALAGYALGEWEGLFEDLRRVQDLLGDRRDSPPYFALRPFAAAALVHEVRGDRAAADRLLAMFERLGNIEAPVGRSWVSWIAPLLARRGQFDDAGALLEAVAGINRGLFLEARCVVAAEQEAWDEVPSLAAEARLHAEEAELLALPAQVDRLEGRAALALGEADRAVALLAKAAEGFSGLEAHWETACTNLWLAEALLAQGEQDRAREHLLAATHVFEDLSAVRELAHSRDLLVRMDEHRGH